MQVRNKAVKKLLGHYREISLLGKTEAVLGWDLNVNLPPKASGDRAEQISQLTSIITDKWHDTEFRETLEGLVSDTSNLNQYERAIVRNLVYASKFYYRVPKKIIVRFSDTTSKSFMAWQQARKDDNFKAFLPHLRRVIELNVQIAEHLGYEDNPYDALLDLYEQGLTTREMGNVFKILKNEISLLLKTIKKSKHYGNETQLLSRENTYSKSDQEKIALFALEKIGYDLDAGRMDVSAHPFTTHFSVNDVRITNRYGESDFTESIMVALHEGGHALYEQGVDPSYEHTPLSGGVSLGIHESQSRFWENQIGRSREFAKFLTPVLKSFYPGQLRGVEELDIYRKFNIVRPSLVRVEADEVTYNLHVALRFDLENKLINGKVAAKDLPEIWRSMMKSYLGVVPQTDADGVMQDVHWSYGSFGYFPTYTLGNLYAAQFTQKMSRDFPLKKLVEAGNLTSILRWQRKNIHRHGSLYWPDEMIKKVTSKPLDPNYFVKYLKRKYTKLYS
ncbi:carboxypeptidase M32 [Patescibacteria group bacterium]